MNRWITLLAVAGSGGVLGARGPVTAGDAAASPWSKSSAASQPIPRPALCRKLRRESSIDINKLAHIEHHQTETRQRIPLQVIDCGLLLFTAGRASEC